MPFVVGYIDPSPEIPGFIIPLFKTDRSDNMLFVQSVSMEDTILSFNQIEPPNSMIVAEFRTYNYEIGGDAAWAFKDHESNFYVGNKSAIERDLEKLYSEEFRLAWPLIQFEIEMFKQRKAKNKIVLNSAFNEVLESSGVVAAEVWRDTEIFAPAFRRDVFRALGNNLDLSKLASTVAIWQKN